MPSPLPVRQQQPLLKLNTKLDTSSPLIPTQYILDEYGTPGGSALATTRYPDINCYLLLLEAKMTMDSGLCTRERYSKGAGVARQALDLALQHDLHELVSRANFYLGEATVINIRQGQQHLLKARQYYSRALDGDQYGTPEAKRAKDRLAELNAMFPTSTVTSTSAVSDRSFNLTSASASSTTGWGPAQARADAHTTKRSGGERIPSFDSVATGSPVPSFDSMSSESRNREWTSDGETAVPEHNSSSAPQIDNVLASIRSSITSVSPKTVQGLGIQLPRSSDTSRTGRSSTSPKSSSPLKTTQSPNASGSPKVAQSPSILKQSDSPEKNNRSTSTSVSFSPETKHEAQDSPTRSLTHRRKRSLLGIAKLPERSDEVLMEEGRSPVTPEF